MMIPVLATVLAYLLGAVPFGFLAGWWKGVDIRQAGSGNIGATNAGRVLGRGWGILVFLLDLAKGIGGVGLGALGVARLDGEFPILAEMGPTVGGLAAFLGHLFPIYLRFRGGKGVATGAGVALGLLPVWCLESLGIWVVFTVSTRMISAGSMVSAGWLAARSGVCLAGDPWHPAAWFGLAGGLFVVLKHRANWARIVAGTENRLKDGWVFQCLPPAAHLLALGAWLALLVFVTFVAGLGLFEVFNGVARQENGQRPYWLPMPSAMDWDSPGKAAGLPVPLWQEQGGILAGMAVSVLFGPYFMAQIGLAFTVMGTALAWWGGNRMDRARVAMAAIALLLALSGAWIEKRVEKLRGQRHEATEVYLVTVKNSPVADSQQNREALRQVRAGFGAWHGLSVGVNLVVLALVAGLVVMAVPAVGTRQKSHAAS